MAANALIPSSYIPSSIRRSPSTSSSDTNRPSYFLPIAKVHGLLGFSHYLDHAEPEAVSALQADLSTLSLGSQTHPTAASLAAIQFLKAQLQEVWRVLKTQTILNISDINRLHDICGSAQGLFDNALDALEKAMRGKIPHDFCTIFSLVALSYAMSTYLVKKGKLTQDGVLRDKWLWRNALAGQERQSFKILTGALWGHLIESNTHSNACDGYFSTPSIGHQSQSGQGSSIGHIPSTPGSCYNTQQYDLPSGSDLDHVGVSDLDVQHAYPPEPLSTPSSFHPPDVVGIESGASPGSLFGPMDTHDPFNYATSSTFTGDPQATMCSSFPMELDQPLSPSPTLMRQPDTRTSDEDLRASQTFRNILSFLNLDLLGDLLHELSVGGLTVKEPHEMQRREVIKRMSENFVVRLTPTKHKVHWSSQCQAVVSVAGMMLDHGYFDGISEVRAFIDRFGEMEITSLTKLSQAKYKPRSRPGTMPCGGLDPRMGNLFNRQNLEGK